MYSCKQASELTCKAQDQSLSLREKLSLRMHLIMCTMCRRYAKQISFIRRATQRLSEDAEGDKNIHLSEEGRERITNKIKQSRDENKLD